MTYDEQVEALAKYEFETNNPGTWERLHDQNKRVRRDAARDALAVIGIEPPLPGWPTDDSMRAYAEARGEEFSETALRAGALDGYRADLREALVVDPIIKASVALRDDDRNFHFDHLTQFVQAVVNAVNRAGL